VDEVAERTKASVTTRTVAGSNTTMGDIFLRPVTVSGERGRHPQPGHGRYLDTGAHLKFLSKNHTRVQNLQFPTPQATVPPLVVEASTQKKKNKI